MRRVLVLAHREELIYQAAGHAKRAGLVAGIEMGASRCKKEQVVVATVQTLVAKTRCQWCGAEGCPDCGNKGFHHRMERFDPYDFGAVIVDEGHHATAKTYRRVLMHFRQNPELKVLLVTATPQRSDKVGLWNVVDSCAFDMGLKDAIDGGWLCPIRQRFVTVHGLDLSRVATKAGGDLADGEVERQFLGETTEDEERLLHEIAKPSIDQAKGRPLLIFAAGVEHAEKLTAACNSYYGIEARCVVGKTDKAKRKEIISQYKAGDVNVLVGCGVFTEGFDAPATEVVAIARPTKSLSLYLQMIGRGTRPLPGTVDGLVDDAAVRRQAILESLKPSCVILDFVGNAGEHKLISVADCLAGEAIEDKDLTEAIIEAKQSSEPVDMEALLEKAKQAREAKEQAAAEQRRVTTQHTATNCDYTAQDVDLFRGDPLDLVADYVAMPGKASEAQVRFLVKLGVAPETAMECSKNQAGTIISKLKGQKGSDYIMPGGKYRGKKLKDTPRGYQDWLLTTDAMGAAEHVRQHRAGS